MALKSSTEIKIINRGKYYLTPFQSHHIEEFEKVISPENTREILLMGHKTINEALHEMFNTAEVYLAREEGGDIIFVGGLWHSEDLEFPQLFALFSNAIVNNFAMLARGSKMLINFFDKTQGGLCMTILSDYEDMLSWAAWLGFEPVGTVSANNSTYVDFVRCNPNQKNVYDLSSRPVMH